jgi:hypothetical protein
MNTTRDREINMKLGWEPAPPGFKEMIERRQREAEMRISDTPNRQFISTLETRINNIGVLKDIEMMDLGEREEMGCAVFSGHPMFYNIYASKDPYYMPLSWLTDMEVERIVYLKLLDPLAKLVMEMSSLAPRVMDTSSGGHVLMMFAELETCPICGRFMVQKSLDNALRTLQRCNPQSHDIQEIGVRAASYDTNFVHICDRCEKEGRVMFRCYLCREEYPTSESEWSIGDPREHLCKKCYRTVSAEKWDKIVEELEEAHKYDYC